jgi:threonine dehydrogenase-like Zn-dependent dehydrogenase
VSEQESQALWYVGPGRAELRAEPLPPPAPGEVRLRALYGGISRGTERLVFSGRVPKSEFERMRGPHMAGDFPFPVKYGYSVVARVEQGPPALSGRLVFALHPHQESFNLPADLVVPLPDEVPAARAVLAANMETALNAMWDGAPGPADRIAVVGGGVVGLLVLRLCARLPRAEVTLVDIAPARAEIAHAFGAWFALPEAPPKECDCVFHASGSGAGLSTALRIAGEETAIVEMSWYGATEVAAPLGEAFHSRRLRLVSSQVGRVAPSHRPRWTSSRRLAAALDLLNDPELDRLLAPAVPFADLPPQLARILGPESDPRCALIRYPDAP